MCLYVFLKRNGIMYRSKSTSTVVIICILFQMLSCRKEENIRIGSFKELPSEIGGCACYFSNNKKEFQLEKYICADDYFKNAYILINDKKVILKNVEASVTVKKETHWKKTFKSEEYQMTIEMFQMGEIDEINQQKGFLILKNIKTGQEIKSEFYGECGC